MRTVFVLAATGYVLSLSLVAASLTHPARPYIGEFTGAAMISGTIVAIMFLSKA